MYVRVFNTNKTKEKKMENIKNLQELFELMVTNNSIVLDKKGNGWSSELPTFGGEGPGDTYGVWSWDEENLIVGTCADDLAIVKRD